MQIFFCEMGEEQRHDMETKSLMFPRSSTECCNSFKEYEPESLEVMIATIDPYVREKLVF